MLTRPIPPAVLSNPLPLALFPLALPPRAPSPLVLHLAASHLADSVDSVDSAARAASPLASPLTTTRFREDSGPAAFPVASPAACLPVSPRALVPPALPVVPRVASPSPAPASMVRAPSLPSRLGPRLLRLLLVSVRDLVSRKASSASTPARCALFGYRLCTLQLLPSL
jgi:hypothetical protein